MATVYNKTETTLYLDLDLNVEEVAPGETVQMEVGNFYAVMFEGYGNDFFLVYIPPPGGVVSSNPSVLSAEGQADVHMHSLIDDGVVSIYYDYEGEEEAEEEGDEGMEEEEGQMDEGQDEEEGELNVEGDEEQEEESYE